MVLEYKIKKDAAKFTLIAIKNLLLRVELAINE